MTSNNPIFQLFTKTFLNQGEHCHIVVDTAITMRVPAAPERRGACEKPLLFVMGTLVTLLLAEKFTNIVPQGSSLLEHPASSVAKTPLVTRTSHFRTYSQVCDGSLVSKAMLEDRGTFFKSQDGEDEMLLKWFNGLCNGTYVEMGALDGVTFSNSYVFNRLLGWKGLLVELSPDNYKQLIMNRTEELSVINAGVCEEEATMHFMEGKYTSVGGIWEFSTQAFRNEWWWGKTINDTIEVTCKPLHDIFRENVTDINFFDFFSLDIEGAELNALKSVDFSVVGFGIIFVEISQDFERKNLALRQFMSDKGYNFLMEYGRSYWFVNEDFFNIYQDVLYEYKQ
jgi:FkbM family methyltransferase